MTAATIVLLLVVVVALAMALVVAVRRSGAYRRSYGAALESLSRRPGGRAAEREALRLGRILVSLPDGVIVLEGDEVAYANPAAARLLGGDPARVIPAVRANPRDPVILTVHHPLYRELRCTRAALEAGSEVLVLRDVTEQRRLDRMRQDFVANASHELKTPVAAILATAETLQSAIDENVDAARRFVRALSADASRLSALVQDLLDLARLDQAGGETPGPIDARSVVDELVAEYRGQGPRISFEISGSEHLEVQVRAQDLALAVRNLLDNAVRATPESGRIEISLSAANEAEIAVRDTGTGIPAKDLARIFERFYRVDAARSRETGGTGLGLAIVKHVIETAGGSVTAESTYGTGSTFTIRLPHAQ